jgi:hypothetical protein
MRGRVVDKKQISNAGIGGLCKECVRIWDGGIKNHACDQQKGRDGGQIRVSLLMAHSPGHPRKEVL